MNKYERLATKCCRGWSPLCVRSFIAGAKAMDNQIKRDQYYDCDKTRRDYQKRIDKLYNEKEDMKVEHDNHIMNFIQCATTWMASCVGTPNAAEFKAAMENVPHDNQIYEDMIRRVFTCCIESIQKHTDYDQVLGKETDGEEIKDFHTYELVKEIQNKIRKMIKSTYGITTDCYTTDLDKR